MRLELEQDKEFNEQFDLLMENIMHYVKRGLDMNMEQFSESIGLTKSGFYQMIKNRSLKVKTLMQIASVLDKSIHELLNKDHTEPNGYNVDFQVDKLTLQVKYQEKLIQTQDKEIKNLSTLLRKVE